MGKNTLYDLLGLGGKFSTPGERELEKELEKARARVRELEAKQAESSGSRKLEDGEGSPGVEASK